MCHVTGHVHSLSNSVYPSWNHAGRSRESRVDGGVEEWRVEERMCVCGLLRGTVQ